MKSREEFAAKFTDELCGLLVAAMSEGLKPNEFAINGRFMIQQMKRGRDLLDRMYYDLAAMPEAPKPTNGMKQPTPQAPAQAKGPECRTASNPPTAKA